MPAKAHRGGGVADTAVGEAGEGSAATVTTRSQSGGLKRLLMEAKEESKDPGFKFNTQKTKIRESSPVTSWQTVETVADFNYLGSKITADSDCSHEGC